VTLEQQFDLGVAHHRAGRLDEAQAAYRQVLLADPNHAGALNLLGLIAAQNGDDERAIGLISRSVQISPKYAEAHINLANSLARKGRYGEAVASYQRAIKAKPAFFAAHCNLAVALKNLGRLDEAIAAAKKAIQLNPDFAEGYNNLGLALASKGQYEKAVAAFERAIQLNPKFTDGLCNLANTFSTVGRDKDAVAVCNQAITVNPQCAEAYNNLALALFHLGEFDEAEATLKRAIPLNPNFADAHNNLANVLKEKALLDEAIREYRRAVQIAPLNPTFYSNLLNLLHFHPAYGQAEMLGECRAWAERHAAPLKPSVRPHKNNRDPERPLRIGYVSPDFRSHTLSFFFRPLFAAHDREQCEIYGYSNVAKPDAITDTLRGHCRKWQDIIGMPDSVVADAIRADRIDILVDTTMHMARNRLLVFARKPAPIQVCWLAYPGTTGIDAMDYRVTDPYLDPSAGGDQLYSEKSIRLPNSIWCFDPFSDEGVEPPPALKNGFVTFGCLNNFCKINDGVLSAWSQILSAVPNSRLLLHAPLGSSRQWVLDRLKFGTERVEFVQRRKYADYLKAHHQIDITLDTFPYNGHTTGLDSVWMGVPIITKRGETSVSRGGASILAIIEFPELISDDVDGYVSGAVQLAGNPQRLSELRGQLRQRLKDSPLMDGPRFARDLENAYRQMWRAWCATAQ
jgi:protein O-GlcNAc transferase